MLGAVEVVVEVVAVVAATVDDDVAIDCGAGGVLPGIAATAADDELVFIFLFGTNSISRASELAYNCMNRKKKRNSWCVCVCQCVREDTEKWQSRPGREGICVCGLCGL